MDGFQFNESEEHSQYLLGVHIQGDLKWTKQVDEVKSKLKTRLTGLSKPRNIVPSINFRKQIAEGIFTSVLVYCIPLLGCCDKGDTRNVCPAAGLLPHHYGSVFWLSLTEALKKIRKVGSFKKALKKNIQRFLDQIAPQYNQYCNQKTCK